MKNLFTFICVLFLCWVITSWAEVASKNLSPNPDYSPHNFFVVIWGD